MPDISAKVCSSSSVIPFNFSCSDTSSSSSLSTSFCSFCTDLSANSARASACFNLAVRVLICSLLDASLWFAFSSDTSKDFRLFATTLNSSSSSTILISPTSALSSGLPQSGPVSSAPHRTFCPRPQLGSWLPSVPPRAYPSPPHPVAIVCRCGCLVQFLGGKQQLVLTGLQVAFQPLHTPVKCIDFKLR